MKGLSELPRTSTESRARMVWCGVRPRLLKYPDARALSLMSA